jgi:DNA-binding transcriptional ArsR family regulator
VITRVLLPGLALIVLLGVIKGLSTGTRLFAFSWLRRKIWVMTWSPRRETASTETVPACSFASASGTTLKMPPTSTTVKPRPRSAARKLR